MATVTVSNPLYYRLAGTHPVMTTDGGSHVRPKIPVDTFLSILEEWGTGAITAAAANAIITSQSGYPNPDADGSINVGLDTIEQLQAQDLFSTVSGLGQAQQGSRFHKVHSVLYLVEMAAGATTGYGPDDMAGTLLAAGTPYSSGSGANGGKLSVPRRDQTYTV